MTVPNETAPLSFSTSEPTTSVTGSSPATAKETAKTAADQASSVAGAAAGNVKAVASEASTQTKAVVAQAKDHVQTLATQTKGELLTQADAKSQQAASGLRTLSEQISALGDGRPGDAGPLTHYLQEAQDKVSSLASRLEAGGPQGVLDDLTAYARRRPGMFLLGAVGAGVVVGRMVRSGKAAVADQHDSADSTGRPALSAPATASALSSVPTVQPPVADSGYPDAPAVVGEVLMTPPTIDGMSDRLDTLP